MPEESTTPDLVELTRRALEAWSSGDLDLAISFFAPDAVVDSSPMGMYFTEGRAAILENLEALHGSYDELSITLEEDIDLGNGVIFAVVLMKGRLPGSSGELRLRVAGVFAWTDGLITRETNYSDIDKARAAAERLAESRG